MITTELLLTDLVTATEIALISQSLTAIVGLFVASLAYRGYQRNDAPRMGFLAVGIGLLTAGVFLVALATGFVGGSDGVVLVARGAVTVVGLGAILYALTYG